MLRNYGFVVWLTFFILINGKNNNLNEISIINAKTNQMFSLKLLLTGTLQELKSISRKEILDSLWALKHIEIPLERTLIIWDKIKGNRSSRTLSRQILELSDDILINIPESDLYNLNITDWNIVDFLGTFDGFSRRKTGIIAYAVRNYWGEDILDESNMINKFKGLICGFAPKNLKRISSSTFIEISEKVFTHIYACTDLQLEVLLQNTMKMTAYGPPQAWNAYDVQKIGLIIGALDFHMLSKLRPESVEGISHNTISRMSRTFLIHLSNEQVKHLSNASLNAYRAIIGSPNSFTSASCKSNKFLIMCCMIRIIHFN